jgi:hypothetical protein
MAFTADKTRQGSAGVSTGDYEIENSLRFNDDDSPYLGRTFGTPTDGKKWTWSSWVKKTVWDNSNRVVFQFNDGSVSSYLQFTRNGLNKDIVFAPDDKELGTTAKFRDSSAWFHILGVSDTTLLTPSDRTKLYINGVRVTDFATQVNQTLNATSASGASGTKRIGSAAAGTNNLDGYLAEVNFIDGQALTQSDFGEEGIYGEWKPIAYTGTYGNNGFYLNFKGDNTVIAATGGTVYTNGDYKYHKFTADGTFTVTSSIGASVVDALVIAGGGGGGGDNGGGAGAGGYLFTAEHTVTATAYSITVGDGGIGSTGGGNNGTNGQNSVFHTLTATGGGRGGTNNASASGANGGSGGGAGGGTGGSGGTGTSGQGNAGASSGGNTSPKCGGGGGGAGAVGTAGPNQGHGGIGSNAQSAWATITSSGDGGYYAGGGAGGHEGSGSPATGGLGGGGDGKGSSGTKPQTAGTDNTGGGGGAGTSGAAGGSGIIIIRYKYK